MGQIHAEAYEEMGVKLVSYDKADIISIAMPDEYHGGLVIYALEAGKHVFCEKPLCTNAEHLAIIKMPRRINNYVDICVGQNYPLRHAFDFLKCFDAGNLQRFEGTYVWGRHEKLKNTWRKDDPNYSLILGGMIHLVDLFFHLRDEEIHLDNVSCHGKEIVYANCQIPHGIAQFCLDGAPGDKSHGHSVMLSGDQDGICVVNEEETDKKACLREFIENLKAGTHQNDFRAIDLCLQIESTVSTSANR